MDITVVQETGKPQAPQVVQRRPLDVSVIIPAYNEEAAIGQVIAECQQVLARTPYRHEVLVVDDASTDHTADAAREAGVRVVSRKRRGGSGAARRTGIESVAGDIVVLLDADATYDPADIPLMLSYFPEYDQVNGARTSEAGTLPFLRAPVKFLIRSLASYLARRRIPDLNTGLKAFKRELMARYLWVIPDGFSCVSTMTLAFLCNDHAVTWIPVQYRKRVGQSKFHPVKDTYWYLLTVLRIVMYFKPLSVFLPLAALLFTASALAWALGGSEAASVGLVVLGGAVTLAGLLADLIVAQAKARAR